MPNLGPRLGRAQRHPQASTGAQPKPRAQARCRPKTVPRASAQALTGKRASLDVQVSLPSAPTPHTAGGRRGGEGCSARSQAEANRSARAMGEQRQAEPADGLATHTTRGGDGSRAGGRTRGQGRGGACPGQRTYHRWAAGQDAATVLATQTHTCTARTPKSIGRCKCARPGSGPPVNTEGNQFAKTCAGEPQKAHPVAQIGQ